ncbi:MAG: arsenosugar biosynthesis radical SAM protein ArsS [Nitrospirae bacterium]|nr:arsenosugar biosynthesis radical SAM protein ArsS [Nitrospirota bacterium]
MKFSDRILGIQQEPLRAGGIEILQVNMGYRCNMACRHCHTGAGPGRSEEMDKETIDTVLGAMIEADIDTLDITGGAPELNPHFRYLVREAGGIGRHVIVRTNLTIFFEEGMEDLPEFYADNAVEVVASLPYYSEKDVNRVRGSGTFQKSIKALEKLNSLGYANGSPEKRLNLVYNPAGAFVAPSQETLEEDYRKELGRRYGVSFDRLYVFVNMPIGRFRDYLIGSSTFEKYIEELMAAFNPVTLTGVMCGHLINVGWDGTLYDCDFNQMLGLRVDGACPGHIKDFDRARLAVRKITVDEHCYGCTAGQGST